MSSKVFKKSLTLKTCINICLVQKNHCVLFLFLSFKLRTSTLKTNWKTVKNSFQELAKLCAGGSALHTEGPPRFNPHHPQL